MSSATGKLTIAWCTMFVVGTDLFVVSPLLPLIAAQFALPPAAAGLSVTAFSATYMVAAPFLGQMADRVGRRRMLSCCLVGFAAANLMTAAAPSFAWLLAARIIAGATTAGVSPHQLSFISRPVMSGSFSRPIKTSRVLLREIRAHSTGAIWEPSPWCPVTIVTMDPRCRSVKGIPA